MAPRPLDPVTLAGNHVRLEPLEVSHTAGILSAADVERTTFALAAVPRAEPDDVAWYLGEAEQVHATGRGLVFATVEVSTGTVIGSTRFMNAEYWTTADRRDRPGAPPDAIEIGGTWLTPAAQRTGANTEAKLLMLTHAFEVLGVLRVTIKTDARNARSRANIERVGATFEGVLRSHMRASDGAVRDTAMYSVLAAEWPEVRERLTPRLRPPGAG